MKSILDKAKEKAKKEKEVKNEETRRWESVAKERNKLERRIKRTVNDILSW